MKLKEARGQYTFANVWTQDDKIMFKDRSSCPEALPATLLKKETLAQVFSCEFCEISKSTFFYRTPPVAASI